LERSVQEQAEESLAATLEEAGDVVRLMTIHQSKGLEFPVVFVADMNRKGNRRTAGALLHERWGALIKPPDDFGSSREHLGLRIHQCGEEAAEAEEIIRLLYVATTRAADRLILSAGMMPEMKLESPWLRLLAERFDLRTGLPKKDACLGSMTGGGGGRDHVPDVFVHREPPQGVPTSDRWPSLVRLPQLSELVFQGEPADFPETVRGYAPSTEWLGPISVSRLEERIAGRTPTRSVAADDADDNRTPFAADVVGTVVHRALQRLDVRHPEDWRDVLAGALRNEVLSPNEQTLVEEEAAEMIERFVASPLLRQLANAATLCREIDFALSWPFDAAKPHALITGQIDVLFQTSDGDWHLIDYKTGQFPTSASDAELLAPYALQLGLYALATEQHLGRSLTSIGLAALRPAVRVIRWPWTQKERDELIHCLQNTLCTPM
jgi:ATP-dependent helicase/nuclease subunit A